MISPVETNGQWSVLLDLLCSKFILDEKYNILKEKKFIIISDRLVVAKNLSI